MGIIHVMDPHLSNMIAAGEVVDRPVNIVKECVENALDAGARSISVEVFEGGIKGLVITDDGCGMDEEDAVLAFARHATSKLYDEADLFNIQTMGFRGEALASIAAVAEVDLKTNNMGNGTHIHFSYGKMTEKDPVSCPRGTRIEIRGLFVHTPARFKYLKKAAYEFSIIAETMNKLAIAHPDIRFVLKHDGRLIFQTSGKGDKKEILFQMFGRETAMNALPFYGSSEDFEIEGLAVQPKISRANKNFIYITINDRLVRNYAISKAVIEGYSEYLPPERFPIVFINIKVDPQLVDVNVHPNKLEVRLAKEEYLVQLIINTVENLFSSSLKTVEIDEVKKPMPIQQKMDLDFQSSGSRQNTRKPENSYKPSMPSWQQPPKALHQDPTIQNPFARKGNQDAGLNQQDSRQNNSLPMESIDGNPMLSNTKPGNFETFSGYAKDHQIPVKPLVDDLKQQYGGRSPISGSSLLKNSRTDATVPQTSLPKTSGPEIFDPETNQTQISDLNTYPNTYMSQNTGQTSLPAGSFGNGNLWIREEGSQYDAKWMASQKENQNNTNLNDFSPAVPNDLDQAQDSYRTDVQNNSEQTQIPDEYPASDLQETINQEEPDLSYAGNAFFQDLKIIGQLKKSYILCENEEGLVIIDQHAAQERYHFEQLQDAFSKKVEIVQPLIVPLRVRVTPDVYARVDEINEATDYYGLHFEQFSGNSLILRAVPGWLSNTNVQKFLEDMLSQFAAYDHIDIPAMNRHMIATAACHSSIRFNRTLCLEEMEQVIADLCQCRQPFHCPHGRPTVITLSDSRMRKEFERG